MHTDLAAASFNLVLQGVVLIVDLVDDIAASPRVSDLSNKDALTIFNMSDTEFRSVEAVASALAGSVE